MPVLISFGVACTIVLLCAMSRAWLHAARIPLAYVAPPSPLPGSPRQRWPDYLQRPVQVIGGVLNPFIPSSVRRVLGHWLVRAELDMQFGPAEWLALTLVVGAAAAGLLVTGGVLLQVGTRLVVGPALLVTALTPWLWLRDRCKRVHAQVLRDLPGCLDTLTMALEAGCAFGSALQLAVERAAESPLRRALQRCQQEVRAGRVRREALERLAERMDIAALSAAVAAIVQAEVTGVSLAPVIRAQAARGTQERFSRAEKLAMEAPIRMLAPLVICIFPCTFIVVGFPIAATLFWGG